MDRVRCVRNNWSVLRVSDLPMRVLRVSFACAAFRAADRDWYGSLCYGLFHRPVQRDHLLVSPYRLPDGGLNLITLHRTAGERDFFPRERRLLLLAADRPGAGVGGRPVQPDPAGPAGPGDAFLSARGR